MHNIIERLTKNPLIHNPIISNQNNKLFSLFHAVHYTLITTSHHENER